MSDITAEIETLEHRFMRAWMRGDKGELRGTMLRDFILVVAGEKPQILDRPSFLDASDTRFRCMGYRLGDVVARRYGKAVWFTAPIELEMKLEGVDWSGAFWLTDLWSKGRLSRGWKLAERSLSRMEKDESVSHSIHRLQLWN